MFPEFMGCDTTFGVTREQRNLFLSAGVDGNNKVFTAFHKFHTVIGGQIVSLGFEINTSSFTYRSYIVP